MLDRNRPLLRYIYRNKGQMGRPSALSKVRPLIEAALAREDRAIYARKDLGDFYYRIRDALELPQRVTINRFINYLAKAELLTAHGFVSRRYGRSTMRYTYGSVAPYSLAITLSPRAYLSHGTALGIQGRPTTIGHGVPSRWQRHSSVKRQGNKSAGR